MKNHRKGSFLRSPWVRSSKACFKIGVISLRFIYYHFPCLCFTAEALLQFCSYSLKRRLDSAIHLSVLVQPQSLLSLLCY